jgi:hypothetical protein
MTSRSIDSGSMALGLKEGHKNGYRRHFKDVERFFTKFCSGEK